MHSRDAQHEIADAKSKKFKAKKLFLLAPYMDS